MPCGSLLSWLCYCFQDEESVKHLSVEDLLKGHVKRAKRVRARFVKIAPFGPCMDVLCFIHNQFVYLFTFLKDNLFVYFAKANVTTYALISWFFIFIFYVIYFNFYSFSIPIISYRIFSLIEEISLTFENSWGKNS